MRLPPGAPESLSRSVVSAGVVAAAGWATGATRGAPGAGSGTAAGSTVTTWGPGSRVSSGGTGATTRGRVGAGGGTTWSTGGTRSVKVSVTGQVPPAPG